MMSPNVHCIRKLFTQGLEISSPCGVFARLSCAYLRSCMGKYLAPFQFSRRRSRLGLAWFAAVMMALTHAGCAQWKTEDDPVAVANRPGLPEARIPDNAAIVEVAFLPLVKPLSLDDTLVPAKTREILYKNGIRAGRLLVWEPSSLDALPEEDDSIRLLRQANLASDFESRRRRLSCRDSQPFSLVVRRPSGGELAALVNTSDGVVGQTLQNPQFTFTLRTRQMDDGRLAIRLTPEIQHGDIKQSYLSSDSLAFRVDFNRPAWTLEELAVELPLAEGQAAVIMPSEDAFGIGQQMFVGRRTDQTEEKIAMVVYLRRRPVHGLDGSSLGLGK